MRLLNAKSHKFEEFYDDEIPQYAILSHTWRRREEVTFQEWLHQTEEVRERSGFRKIINTCEQALKDSHEWVWVDTNCIDKSSSAELSEAINSMYVWYRNATVCYVYLEDVPASDGITKGVHPQFPKSRWWTRGWTLQELLAPEHVIFFAQDWSLIGSRGELAKEIELITSINVRNCESQVRHASVARKMSWLSHRQTTRVEDAAYCMLGLFDINMPLLYGEGAKAFIRLQEEIIKRDPDLTIFCWHRDESTPPDWFGLLAPSPKAFLRSGGFATKRDKTQRRSPWTITNLGISIRLPTIYTVDGAYILLDGVCTQTVRNPIIGIPISSVDVNTQFRLPFPREPIIWAESFARSWFRLRREVQPLLCLLPTSTMLQSLYDDTFQNQNELAYRKAPPVTAVVVLIDDILPKSVKSQAPVSTEPPSLTMLKSYRRSYISVPQGGILDTLSGVVTLSEVRVGQSHFLTAAVELHFSKIVYNDHDIESRIRLFLAFGASSIAGKEVRDHHCAISAVPERQSSSSLPSEDEISSLEAWYSHQLDGIRAGRPAQKREPLTGLDDDPCPLKFPLSITETLNYRLITALLHVQGKKARTGWNSSLRSLIHRK